MDNSVLVAGSGIQTSSLRYTHLSPDEIEEAVERMYKRFYFRAKPIFRIVREMATDKQMMVRRLREGQEFFSYLKERKEIARQHKSQAQTAGA
jgi:hypothetical protein